MDSLVNVDSVGISEFAVGPGSPCFIIAEAGVNHNGNPDTAKRMIDAAVAARADAVKFQTFQTARILTALAPKAEYQRKATGATGSQFDMVKQLELGTEAHRELKRYCDDRQIIFLSSPFDEPSADLLDQLGVAALKIASGEITNLRFLKYVASKERPLIVSTGMSTLTEVESAFTTIGATGNKRVILLHCVSCYPADPKDVNLRAMKTMSDVFRVPVGYSDHTRGIEVALAAVAMGASVIEKHFTLDRRMSGPDHSASLEPGELGALVSGIRSIEAAFGDGCKRPAESEMNTAAVARRSLVAVVAIPAGTVLTQDLLTTKRPGTGIQPAMDFRVIGKRVKVPIPADTVLEWEMFE